MRKITVGAEIEVLVPVKVIVELSIRADDDADDADMDKVVKQWATKRLCTFKKADIEEVEVQRFDLGEEIEDDIAEACTLAEEITDIIESSCFEKGKLLTAKVIDSH